MKVDRYYIDKRFASMKQDRDSWLPAWKDIRAYINPVRGFFEGDVPNFGAAIDHKTQLNSQPRRSVRIAASGMQSGLTSQSRPWAKLKIADRDLMRYEPVKEWLEVVMDILFDIYAKSNIYGMFYSAYEELISFGTFGALMLEDFDDVIRCQNFTAGEYMLGVDAKGRVNSFARMYWKTILQLVEEFGEKNVSPSTLNAYKSGNVDQWIQVRHLIEPNDNRDSKFEDAHNKAFRSAQWENSMSQDLALRASGFDDFPVIGARWDTTATSQIYGRGPGWDALGDAKMLMKFEYDRLLALAKVINPPYQVDGSVQGRANLLPGGETAFSASNPNAGVKPAYQINPDLAAIENAIMNTKEDIRSTFYNDLFQMLSQSEPGQQTAYEISKRYEEKLIMLGPVLERLQNELLKKTIERSFNIAFKVGVIPPPPQELHGQELGVEYISILAQAQKMVGITSIDQLLGVIGNASALYPDIKDVVDSDAAAITYGEMLGVPAKILRSPEELVAYREQKQKELAAQQQAAALPQIVDGAKTLSETKMNQNSALDRIVGPGGNQASPVPVGAGQ